MGTLFQSKPPSLRERLPREDDGHTPDFAVPFEQKVQTVEPVRRETTTSVTHDHSPVSGWIVMFLIFVVAIGLGFMSLMELSSQQNRTERELFRLRQEIQDMKLARPEFPVVTPPAAVQELDETMTKNDFKNEIIKQSLPSASEPAVVPTELPPPPVAVTPKERVYGPQPAAVTPPERVYGPQPAPSP